MPPVQQITLSSGRLEVSLTVPLDAEVHAPAVDRTTSGVDKVVAALTHPLGLPSLPQCTVPGDRIVIVADPETPLVAEMITQICQLLGETEGSGPAVQLLLPRDGTGEDWPRLMEELPNSVRRRLAVHVHDPADDTGRGYLASSAAGDRVYLNRHLLEADLIITIGTIGFDGLLGYRGTTSVIFPAFSDAETIREAGGHGHPELTPEERRPLRDLIDEIGWLLGTQFALQVLPDATGGVAYVFAGLPGDVQRAGQEVLDREWRFVPDRSSDLVVTSVPGSGSVGWKQIGAALETACRLVRQGGRIAVVADAGEPQGAGAAMLRRCAEPEDLLKPLRKEPTEDAVEMTQLIQALRRARVFLLSSLPTEIVEDMGLIALGSGAELQRLINASASVSVIPGAHLVWCAVADSVR